MNSIQRYLQQDFGKIIIAVIIVIVVFVSIIVISNISSKAKTRQLEKTRTIHKDQFEAAAAKRNAHTQSISKTEINKALENSENTTSVNLEQTNIINLEAIRKKAQLEERANLSQTLELDREELSKRLEELEQTSSIKIKDVNAQNTNSTNQPIESSISNSLNNNEVKPNAVSIDEISNSKSTPFNSVSIDDLDKAVENVVQSKEIEVKSIPIESYAVQKGSEDINFNSSINDSLPQDNTNLIANDEELGLIDNFDFNNITQDTQTLEVTESTDYLFDDFDDNTSTKIYSMPEFADVLYDDLITEPLFKNENIDLDVLYNDTFNEIEVPSNPVFQTYSDVVELPNIAEFDGFDENSVDSTFVVDEIEFEIPTIEEEDEEDFGNKILFVFDDFTEDVEEKFIDIDRTFDFGNIGSNEESIEEFSKDYESTFDFGKVYVDCDYILIKEDSIKPIFSNEFYNKDLEDIIDATINSAFTNINKENMLFEELTQDVIIDNTDTGETSNNELDEMAINYETSGVETIFEVYNRNDIFIDLTSQLDELEAYKDILPDVVDFEDLDYNYNFNNFKIMDEIVDDVLFDDIASDDENEFFKYVYQFALLDNVIDFDNEDPNFDVNITQISDVDVVAKQIQEIITKVEASKQEEKFATIANTFEYDNTQLETDVDDFGEHVVNQRNGKKIDSELLSLSSLLLDNNIEEVNTENDTAYNTERKISKIYSPIFTSPEDNPTEDNPTEDNPIEDEYIVELSPEELNFINSEDTDELDFEVNISAELNMTLEEHYDSIEFEENDLSEIEENELSDIENKTNETVEIAKELINKFKEVEIEKAIDTEHNTSEAVDIVNNLIEQVIDVEKETVEEKLEFDNESSFLDVLKTLSE